MTIRIKLLFIISFFFSFLYSFNFFSPVIRQENLIISEDELIHKLKYDRIIINSEKVFQDTFQLLKVKDYSINYQEGELSFSKPIGSITIEYMIYPPELLERFYYYEVQEYSDSTEIKLSTRRKKQFYSDANLNITGSKTISISFANNEDFSLDQSLFLKIDGELSENLQIEAQLSDSQSPITPEGDSREISNMDKVFLRLYGKNYELAFGDLEMKFDNTRFMDYSTQFEGLKTGWFGRNNFRGALAISKGKKATINFHGIEAKQGPYYLSTEEAEGVQVIPGSEEVFLNGRSLQRGDDYTIDYSEGSITFKNKHFISSTSYIQVTFQYSDENYRKNLYLFSSEVKVTDNLKLTNGIIVQNDDKENPLQETFSEDDINVLENTGDKTGWGCGIFEAENGLYDFSEEDSCYYYVGNDTTVTGHYNIHFEYVGVGNGNYEYVEDGDYYEYVGEGIGSYLPIKKLISPQKRSNYDMAVNYQGSFYRIDAEGLFSLYDKNSFSELDDDDNDGFAAGFGINVFPDFDNLDPDLTFRYKKIGENISTFAELHNALDNYEFIPLPDTLASEEFLYNLGMNIFDIYSPTVIYRNNTAGNVASQDYFSVQSDIKQMRFFPKVSHRYLKWEQDGEEADFADSDVDQHDLNMSYSFPNIKVRLDLFDKIFTNKYQNSQNFEEKLIKQKYEVSTLKTKKISSRLYYKKEVEERNDFFQQELVSEFDKDSETIGLNMLYNSIKHRLKLDYSHRIVKDSTTTRYDLAEILVSNSFYKNAVNLNMNYSMKNVEFFPKIKEFQYVGEAMGSYDVDSVYVGFNEGDYDWEVTEIDYQNPEMSVEVNTNFTLYLSPQMVSSSFLKRFQTETNLMISENSTESDKVKIYLLMPEILMNNETTIYGRNSFYQTIWYDIINKKLTSKIKYKQEKTLDNRYNDQSERNFKTNWEGNLRLTAIKNANIELLYKNSNEEDSRYDSRSDLNSFELDIRNRFSNDLILKSSFQYSREIGGKEDESDEYEINAYEVLETVTFFFKRKYRLFGKFSYKKNVRTGSSFLSFLADKKEGDIFKWNMNLNYKVSRYISANLEYSGNSYPRQDDVHQLSMEVKAEF
ncbi:MAG: hypothetical protein K8R49_02270 [Candidatus Cloacimonetes bacterium]|nr:hypothetical protein [Candidatus Cloacimonadota bacterium]